MTWDDYRRRKTVQDAVLAEIARRGETEIPPESRPAIRDVFDSEEQFLLALHYRWFRTLTARLEILLEDRPGEPVEAVHRIWAALAAERPALHTLLCAYADNPALIAATAWHQVRLGSVLGVDLARLFTRPTVSPPPRARPERANTLSTAAA